MKMKYSEELKAFKKVFYIPNPGSGIDINSTLLNICNKIPNLDYELGYDLNNNRFAICAFGSMTSIMIFCNKIKQGDMGFEDE